MLCSFKCCQAQPRLCVLSVDMVNLKYGVCVANFQWGPNWCLRWQNLGWLFSVGHAKLEFFSLASRHASLIAVINDEKKWFHSETFISFFVEVFFLRWPGFHRKHELCRQTCFSHKCKSNWCNVWIFRFCPFVYTRRFCLQNKKPHFVENRWFAASVLLFLLVSFKK